MRHHLTHSKKGAISGILLQLQDGEEVVMFEILHVSKSLTSPIEFFFITKKKRNFSEPKEIKNC